jgi:predicted PurR-regulated permease PerM
MKETTKIEVSWHTLLKIFVFLLIILAAYLGRTALGIFFTAIVLSLGIDPIISFLEKRGVKRLLSVIIVFLSTIIIIAGGIYFMIPVISIEATGLLTQVHDVVYSIFGVGLPDNLLDTFTLGREKLFDFLSSQNISVGDTLKNFFNTGISIVSVILICFYLSIEKDGPERLLRVILPDIYEGPVLRVFHRFSEKIRKWFSTQITLSFIVGLIVGVGLWIMGVKYAVVLGILAAIFELVPVIGPLLIGFVAFVVAISDSFMLGIYAVVFFFLVQQFENQILVPIVVGKTMKVHPVVVIMALLTGGEIAGFVGIVLAVPIAVIAQEIFNYLSEQKQQRPYLGI